MNGSTLSTELWGAVSRTRQSHIDRLVALGCPGKSLAQVGARQPAFGIAAVELGKAGLFSPAESGAGVIVQPVVQWDTDWSIPDVVDLIAWQPAQPERWWWRVGTGHALGLDLLNDDLPVRIVSSPLAWLAAGGDALCILDWSQTSPVWPALRSGPCLHFTDYSLRKRVRNSLTLAAPMPPMEIVDVAC